MFHCIHLCFLTTSVVGKSIGNAYSTPAIESGDLNFKNPHRDSELSNKQTVKKLTLWEKRAVDKSAWIKAWVG